MSPKLKRLAAPTIVFLVLLISIYLGKKKSPPISTNEALRPKSALNQSQKAAPNSNSSSKSAPPPGVQKGEPYYSKDQFQAYASSLTENLPDMKVLRSLSKHQVHPEIQTAYIKAAAIGRAAIRQPELKEIALDALEECAKLKGYDASVRSICLRHHRKIRTAFGDDSYDEKQIDRINELDSILRRSFDYEN